MWPQAHSPSLQGSRSKQLSLREVHLQAPQVQELPVDRSPGGPSGGELRPEVQRKWASRSTGLVGGVHTRFILARTLMSQRHRRSESHCSVVCFKASVLPTLHTERAMSWICHNLVLKKRERLFCWKLPPWPKLAYEPPKKISFRIFVWIFACSNDKLPQTQ